MGKRELGSKGTIIAILISGVIFIGLLTIFITATFSIYQSSKLDSVGVSVDAKITKAYREVIPKKKGNKILYHIEFVYAHPEKGEQSHSAIIGAETWLQIKENPNRFSLKIAELKTPSIIVMLGKFYEYYGYIDNQWSYQINNQSYYFTKIITIIISGFFMALSGLVFFVTVFSLRKS